MDTMDTMDTSGMERVCSACGGTGSLLTELCPLCDGAREFTQARQILQMSVDQEDASSGESREAEEMSSNDFVQPSRSLSLLDRFGSSQPGGGLVFLTVVVPVSICPHLTEAEVAHIGTTWTYGSGGDATGAGGAGGGVCEDEPPASRFKIGEDDDRSMCGICLQPFEHGDKLIALPCAEHGCGSIWHLGCMHEWLNQGRSRSCPLCRAQIDTGTGNIASSSTTFTTIIGSSRGLGSGFARDLMPLPRLLQRTVMQNERSSSHGVPEENDLARWMALVEMAGP